MSSAPDSNNWISSFPQDNHCTMTSSRSALYTLFILLPRIFKRCTLKGKDLKTSSTYKHCFIKDFVDWIRHGFHVSFHMSPLATESSLTLGRFWCQLWFILRHQQIHPMIANFVNIIREKQNLFQCYYRNSCDLTEPLERATQKPLSQTVPFNVTTNSNKC